MTRFCSVNYICQVSKLKLLLDMSEILNNMHIDRFLLLAFVKYILSQGSSHVFETVLLDTFCRYWKLLFFEEKCF